MFFQICSVYTVHALQAGSFLIEMSNELLATARVAKRSIQRDPTQARNLDPSRPWAAACALWVLEQGHPVDVLPISFLTDVRVLRAAVQHDPNAITKDVALTLVNQNGNLLRFVGNIKKDIDVSVAAVQNNTEAWEWVSPNLLCDPESVLTMIETVTSRELIESAFQWFSIESAQTFMQKFVQNPGLVQRFADIPLTEITGYVPVSSWDVCEVAMLSNEKSFMFMSEYCKKRWNFVHVFMTGTHSRLGERSYLCVLEKDVLEVIWSMFLDDITEEDKRLAEWLAYITEHNEGVPRDAQGFEVFVPYEGMDLDDLDDQ